MSVTFPEVDRQQIIEMIARMVSNEGTTLRRFRELGRKDELENPELRDLWLIWGSVLTDEDLQSA